MLLVFPTAGFATKEDEKVTFIRSLDKETFYAKLADKLRAGWVVHEMKSSFRKTGYGGCNAYFAELRRLSGGRKKKQLSSS